MLCGPCIDSLSIALQTGRGKNFARLVTFAEARAANDAKLHDILARHGLEAGWKRFEQNYLNLP